MITLPMPTPPKRENLFLNLGFNLLLPVLLLNKGSKWFPSIDPAWMMVIALAFPVAYFIYDYIRRRKRNLLSILGATGVLLTGGISLTQMPPIVFAIKEALMPLLIGIFVVVSTKTKNPLIHALLYNPDFFDVEKIDGQLDTSQKKADMNALMLCCTWIIALSFLVSAILNFFISVMVVKTHPAVDRIAYNEEVSTQLWVSQIAILLCTMPITIYAMLKLFQGIEKLTGLKMEDVLHGAKDEKKDKSEPEQKPED